MAAEAEITVKTKTLAVLASLLLPLFTGGAVYMAKAFAEDKARQEVAPVRVEVVAVKEDVIRLKTQREEDVKRQEEMRKDIKELLARTPPRRNGYRDQ